LEQKCKNGGKSLFGGHKVKLSIIIPNYNYSKSLGDTLDSLIDQRVLIYELIVIDDASTDSTLEYAKKYPIKIFKILRSEFGHGKTRNLGKKSTIFFK
jgi:rhamnosyltransferase